MLSNPKLLRIAQTLRGRYPELKQILFFGSQARGDATAESDIDCLLIFDEAASALKQSVDRFSAELLLDEGVVLSCIVLGVADLDRLRYEPFLRNALREGIAA
ncbi:MAG: nucleotidyltransferase domain-containing protein [Candidatus Omnitrophica bacterium]|nr:nucleotidyltransferase domain-containing protein [Candidatus Omnitrophota bacterium]